MTLLLTHLQLLKLTSRMVCTLYLTEESFLEMLICRQHLEEEGLRSPTDKAM